MSTHRVSIPYLRVTHARELKARGWPEKFQSPIYGSRTVFLYPMLFDISMFQSPIYGSRTWEQWLDENFDMCFNPLSTGHALRDIMNMTKRLLCFNPLSTGHAHGCRLFRLADHRCFNPLSTGHARKILLREPEKKNRVSIPYLRVTHITSVSGQGGWIGVSIPYLRVTHKYLFRFPN